MGDRVRLCSDGSSGPSPTTAARARRMRRYVVSAAIWALVANCGSGPRSPFEPLPPPPLPPLGNMVATVDGRTWTADSALAERPLIGDPNAVIVTGVSDTMFVDVNLPGRYPRLGSYTLGAGPSGSGAVFIFVRGTGYVGEGTDQTHTGVATVTAIDSLAGTIGGYFHFTTASHRVTDGRFNVLIREQVVAEQRPRAGAQ